jgi:hypothetical protein
MEEVLAADVCVDQEAARKTRQHTLHTSNESVYHSTCELSVGSTNILGRPDPSKTRITQPLYVLDFVEEFLAADVSTRRRPAKLASTPCTRAVNL